jgi:hypothetical protein
LHFITCSCYRRQPFLGTPSRRGLFLKVLEQVRRRYRGLVLAPEQWRWSSFRPYYCGEPVRVRINDCDILKMKR